MCYPRNDQLIMRLIEEGRLFVCGAGRGHVFLRDVSRSGVWREVGHEHKAQQAGKRPRAAEYRSFGVKVDGRVRRLRVNRVVWVFYHGPTCLEVDHVDDDALACGIENLNPLTRFDNQTKAREVAWLRERGLGPEEEDDRDDVVLPF